MSTPAVPVEEVGVPLTFDDDPRESEIEIDDTVLEASMAAFNDGMLSEADFEKPQQPVYTEPVPVVPFELPVELDSDAPQCEQMMSTKQAEEFLDRITGDARWRQWGSPPFVHVFNRVWFSPFDLEQWVARRRRA
jgi:hypothetical protein